MIPARHRKKHFEELRKWQRFNGFSNLDATFDSIVNLGLAEAQRQMKAENYQREQRLEHDR